MKVVNLLQIFKPIALSIFGVALFIVWSWLSMSGIDYHAGSSFFGLQSAGWFFLGLPFLVGIGMVVMLPFTFLARKFHTVIGWVAIVVITFPMIGFTFVNALPSSRLPAALNVEIPAETKIIRLRVVDSFNDGIHTCGSFTGSPELIRKIADSNKLDEGECSLQTLRQWLDDDTIPEHGFAFQNDFMTCYFDSTDNTIHFHCRSSLPAP